MDSPFTNLDFERFIYRQGQLLASRDFRDQQHMETARRWMHNTAMHNAWGVAVGYEFSLPEAGEAEAEEEERLENIWEKGQQLTVQPGIAYDCFGRELILPQTVTFSRENLPDDTSTSQRLFLVASYQEARSPSLRLYGSGSPGSVPFPPPRLQWKPEAEVNYGLEVPILFITVGDNGPQVQRYSASQLHPQARPKMASGRTLSGQTAWKPWQVQLSESAGEFTVPTGLEVDIDTSDAGFQQTPCYFAWLNGPLSALIEGLISVLREFRRRPPLTSLANETPDGFTFRLFFPIEIEPPLLTYLATNQNQPEGQNARANLLKLTVCWLGIEAHEPDLPPPEPVKVSAPENNNDGPIG
jgi:hypothetical protein